MTTEYLMTNDLVPNLSRSPLLIMAEKKKKKKCRLRQSIVAPLNLFSHRFSAG